jgi:ADP-ribose pyrophosphatase
MGKLEKPELVGRETVYDGTMITVHRDTIRQEGREVLREVVEHPDAVAVVALDDDDRVVLVRQWRHPVGEALLELPAGLLDKPDEPALDAARRELAEETRLAAETWHTLLDVVPSPGMSTERARVFLARGVGPAGGDAHPDADEGTIEVQWLAFDEAVGRVRTGEITNALAVCGLLAAADARRHAWTNLRTP